MENVGNSRECECFQGLLVFLRWKSESRGFEAAKKSTFQHEAVYIAFANFLFIMRSSIYNPNLSKSDAIQKLNPILELYRM